jgi:hypothetical protein
MVIIEKSASVRPVMGKLMAGLGLADQPLFAERIRIQHRVKVVMGIESVYSQQKKITIFSRSGRFLSTSLNLVLSLLLSELMLVREHGMLTTKDSS